MKKISKIFLKILIIMIIFQFFIVVPKTQAAFWDDIFSAGDKFLQEGSQGASNGSISSPSDADVQQIISDIYSILFPLGVVVTVAIGGVLGIKFMMASAEDKAKVKESMVPYVIGCVVIYGAFGIWKIAITIFSALS